jgi:uncharacterized membrane protein
MSAGRVFERAFATILHNPGVTLGLALLFGAIPGVLMTYGMTLVRQDIYQNSTSAALLSGFFILSLLSALLGLAISAFVQGMLTKATVAESEGRKAQFAESARAALTVALPLIGLSILLAIGVGIGFILLIVPGAMLYIAWSVAAPALVEERQGVFASFGRSNELTKGARWKIFGILVVLMVAYYVLSLLSAAIGFATVGTLDAESMAAGLPIGFMLTNLVVGLLVNVFWGTVQASLYVELRDWKDGPAVENLEEVFG